jgi:thiamine biosynthesis lipoprotein ApbE
MVEAPFAIADGRALGSGVRVAVTRPATIGLALRAVDEVLRAVDAACSRFRPDSEIVALNAAPGADRRVSPLLARAVGVALDAARASDGAVDPTVGTAVRLAGYDRDFAALSLDDGPIRLVTRSVPGWRSVRLDAVRGTVRLPHGVEIDLGATAKALAADLAAEAALEAAGGGGALVSLGGDVAVRGEAPPGGWRIQVGEDSGAPLSDDEEAVAIAEGGLATSGTTVRRWTRGGVELHHIIDPRTGVPARGPWRTATVAATTCVDANTAATAAIVLGPGAIAWLTGARLPARLVDRRGAVRRLAGWPRPHEAR